MESVSSSSVGSTAAMPPPRIAESPGNRRSSGRSAIALAPHTRALVNAPFASAANFTILWSPLAAAQAVETCSFTASMSAKPRSLVAQRLDGIEPRGLARRIEAEKDSHHRPEQENEEEGAGGGQNSREDARPR